MRRLLGSALATLGLAAFAGCGGTGSTANDPAATTAPTSSTTTSTTSPAAGYHVTIVSATGAGGRVVPQATPVSDPAAVDAFVRQFRGPGLATQVRAAVAQAPGGTVLAAVISIGCDVPPGATVEDDGTRVTVTPQEVVSPLPECLAPVTSVAVVSR